MGMTAENIAERWGITRAEQDAFAAASQNKAEKAVKEGRFRDELVPVPIPVKGGVEEFRADEYPRAGVTAESLAKLKPAFKKDGTVTAGNASGLNDGAAALVLASADKAREAGRPPLARYVTGSSAAINPAVMGMGPVEAVKKALARAGWSLSDVDLHRGERGFRRPVPGGGQGTRSEPGNSQR